MFLSRSIIAAALMAGLGSMSVAEDVVISANFDSDIDGFTYEDDTLYDTFQPDWIDGDYTVDRGFEGTGGLEVVLGSSDMTAYRLFNRISGGWKTQFTIPVDSPLSIKFRFNMTQTDDFSLFEYARIDVKIDDTVREAYQMGSEDRGGGDMPASTGWMWATVDFDMVKAGEHTLIFGLYSNKIRNDERSCSVVFDDLSIVVRGATESSSGTGQTKTCNAADYEIPDGVVVQPPFDRAVGTYIKVGASITPGVGKAETPIAIRNFALIEGASWNCVAAYDEGKLDALRLVEPIIQTPSEINCDGNIIDIHTTDARTMCFLYLYGAILPTLAPASLRDFQQSVAGLGGYSVPVPTGIDDSVVACGNDVNCLETVASENNYNPYIMASIIAQDALQYGLDDGFNMDGSNGGECEYNCRPYSDTTGYKSVNLDNDGIKERWQPLLEDDGTGFFFRQEHVTPHIGFTAVPRIMTRQEVDSREVDNPKYNLKEEAELVVQRMANLDDTKKMEVELFDNKADVIVLISQGLLLRYGNVLTFERVLLFTASYLAAEQDSVILAWKEKVRNDLVRTTTVVQQRRYGTPDEVETWAGPYQGVQTFKASEFQPYIRVMPHAEYPSGSSCICQANIEATKAYMKVVFDDDGAGYSTFRPYKAGSSKVEPGFTPQTDLTLNYPSLESISDACGRSRLDGGMHFRAAVENGYQLCSGFAPLVEDFIELLLNGTDDLKTTYVPGSGPPIGGPPVGGGGGPPVGGGGVPPVGGGGGGPPVGGVGGPPAGSLPMGWFH